jgi:hypothetical protein
VWSVGFAEIAEQDPGVGTKGELFGSFAVGKVKRGDSYAGDVWWKGFPVASFDWDRLGFAVLLLELGD